MRSFINYFIKNSIAANLLMFAIAIMGVVGMLGLKSTFFPEVESRIINIQIVYPGASPEEIEEGVVSKIEENLKGLTGIERIRSTSKENAGTITVEIFQGYDIDVILPDVKNAVDQINSFPANMEPPVVYKLETLGFAISLALSGDVDLKTLKRSARQVEDDLRAIEGISKIELSGFPDEEIEIAFREQDLRAFNLTFQQATQAIAVSNLEITGGTVKGQEEELLVRARNKAYYAAGLRDIIVKTTENGSVIRLHQIADIKDQWADDPNRSFLNGKPSVVVTVQNTLEEDMITITDKVKVFVEEFNEKNDVVNATVIRDGSTVLKDRINLLTENGILGFVIVVILLAMFLHYRLAFWVALAIPISFAGMFIFANLLGITINVISLFGMILVIGILVDDGIVIGESIYQSYEKGVPQMQAALDGTMKVLPAVFAAILTTIIAFSAFFFIDGTLGDFFYEMAIVVIFSLVFSLVEGALILPTHVAHSKALSPTRTTNIVQDKLEATMEWLKNKFYAPILRFVMYNKFLTISSIVTILFVVVGLLRGGYIQTTFFPVIDRDNVNISIQMPAGTTEEITMDWLDHIEASALQANEELSETYFNGEKDAVLRIEKSLGPSTYQGSVNLTLLEGELRDSLSARDVVNAVRRITGPIYEADVITFGAASAFGKPVSLALVGENLEELNTATDKLKKRMQSLAELADVVDNNQEGLREINISLKDKALYLGLNLQEIVGQVRSGFFGSEVQRLQRGRDEVKVWVRYKESDRSDISKLENMHVRFNDGREFPLSAIANLEIERGVISIDHLNGKRSVKLEADIANDEVSVSNVTSTLKTEIVPAILAEHPSVRVVFEGQAEEQAKSSGSIMTTGIVILAMMFFSIALTFGSISQTFVVFLLIPFSLIGVGLGHMLMGAPISMFSNLGVVALIGILVNDALVFVSTYNGLLKEGKPQMDALYEAGVSRFRPIILTTFTTFAGLAPILFEKSLQAQFLIPMAISVSFGLLAITFIILVLLPVLLIVANRFKFYASYAWNGIKPTYEAVEPATPEHGGYDFLWYLAFAFIATMIGLSFI